MKKLILKGGLGNQLFQVAHALRDEKELTIIDWCLARPALENGIRPPISQYNLPANFVYIKSRTTMDRIMRPTYFARGVINQVFSGDYKLCDLSFLARVKLFTYFRDFYLLIPQKKKSSMSSRIIAGYFQEIPSLSEIQLKSLYEIPLPECSEEVLRLKEMAKVQKPIIVHMRIGDYEESRDLGVLPTGYFKEALNELSKKVENFETYPIWLFSDSPEKAIVKFPNEYSSRMELIPKSELTAVETLEVMRSGHHYVISNSTFSWWAAYLSESTETNVIYPDPWFANTPYSEKLFPENWVPVNSGLSEF